MKDRSDLSSLYPKISIRTDNLNNRFKKPTAQKRRGGKLYFRYMLSISALLTLAVVTLMTMVSYFGQIVDAGSIINLLPMITILLIAWVGFLVAILAGVSKSLEKTSVDNFMFFIIYGLCALPIAQLMFNVYRNFNNGLVDILPFMGMLFIENLVFVSSIMILMNSEKISGRAKNTILVSAVLFCAVATFINANF